MAKRRAGGVFGHLISVPMAEEGYHFTQHYTLQEARALLPQLRTWLEELARLYGLNTEDEEHQNILFQQGLDVGGVWVNRWVRNYLRFHRVLREFECREIQIKDLRRGLVDFPSFRGDQEVFLCWEKDESDIEFWHDLNDGYTGRSLI